MGKTITAQGAIEVLQGLHYTYRGKHCDPKHEHKIKNLLCNAVAKYQMPVACLVTVWLNESTGATISQLTDFINLQFRDNKVLDGKRVNAAGEVVPVFRSRGRPLFVWVRETKPSNAPDCFSDSGQHYHLALCFDAKYSKRHGFIPMVFQAAIAKGIIKAPDDVCKYPAFITGNHNLTSEKGLADASYHLVRYCAKQQTKVKTDKPSIGGSRLENIFYKETIHV